MLLHVTVTHEDIKKGKKNEPEHCPIARALDRLYPGNDVSVNEDTVEIDDLTFTLPERAETFVSKFDAGEKVKPLKFVIDY